MNNRSSEWKVEITSRGRIGDLVYWEDGHDLRCSWEFEGGESLAVIFLPDTLPSWAAQNLRTIMSNIGDYVIRTQAPLHTAEINERERSITIKRPAK